MATNEVANAFSLDHGGMLAKYRNEYEKSLDGRAVDLTHPCAQDFLEQTE
jgi:hypothetical protein